MREGANYSKWYRVRAKHEKERAREEGASKSFSLALFCQLPN